MFEGDREIMCGALLDLIEEGCVELVDGLVRITPEGVKKGCGIFSKLDIKDGLLVQMMLQAVDDVVTKNELN